MSGEEEAVAITARYRFRSNLQRQKQFKDEMKQLLQEGKAKEALHCGEKALKIFPEHLGILALVTEAREKLGLPPE